MTSDVLSTVQSSDSLHSASSGMQQQAPISIHPDALPCLKRQQLENLCVRLGVKSTGKKSELIARLEGFAMGKSASTLSMDLVSSSTSSPYEHDDDMDKENQTAYSEEVEDADTSMMLPGVASIRIISKPRESHFVSAAAADKQREQNDANDAEMGLVLPKSDSRYGSLSGLGVRAPLASASNNGASNFMPTRKESATTDDADGGKSSSKRSFSAASLYPWKKLAAHKQSNSSDSISTIATNAGLAQVQQAEMGLGLHASDSQASISSTLRRWLKGEGASAVVPASESQIALVQIGSCADVANGVTVPTDAVQVDADVCAKRKRSCDVIASNSHPATSPEPQHEESSPEIPQRRIKPRPSRAVRRTTAKIASEVEAAQSPIISVSAENKVLAEMQSRLAAKTAERQAASASTSAAASAAPTPPLPPSPLKSVSSRTRGRFSSQHEKQFGRMDSIATHYAAVRAREQVASASPTPATDRKEEVTEDETRSKRARLERDAHSPIATENDATAPTAVQVTYAALSPQRTEEERAAIRRKLDIARHRRRSSTAVGRKSGTTTTGGGAASRKANALGRGPSAKLAAHNGMPSGIAQKISFAVRGFMGAARGLTTTTTSSTPAAPTPAAVPVAKRPAPATTTMASMPPPPSPSKERLTKKLSMQSVAATSSPAKTAGATAVTKKRSAFDLQASLARKPVGYKPYSARETVEMFAGPSSMKARSTSDSNRSSSSSSNNSSQIPFPASTSGGDRSNDSGDKTGESSSASVLVAPSVTPRRVASSTLRGSSNVGGKKTRSSASHKARASLKSPRKSTAAAAAAGKASSPAVASPRARRRTRQPSLQVAGQTMASQMMSARRQRNNALTSEMLDATDHSPASQQPADNAVVNVPTASTPISSPVVNATQTAAAGGLGHGSPRKTGAIPLHVHGRGRGTSSVVERTATASPKSALQRKSSSIASTRA